MPPTPARSSARSATRTSSTTPFGLPVHQLVGTLGGGLLTVVVETGPATIDDVTLAEPGSGVYGQAGDLLLGVGVDRPADAAALLERAAEVGCTAVVLRRVATRNPQVRAAAARFGVGLVELADHASWAHVVWLLRGVLDRAASGPSLRAEGPVLDELFALADACAALVGAPVTIEDTQSRVLAYSSTQDVADPARLSTIVGRRVPDEVIASLRGRGVFRRLARSEEPFFVAAGRGLRARLVVPVRAGTEWLGSIWAVVDEEPAEPVLRSLRQTASVVALHLLRMRSQADLARRVMSDRLRAVLSGDVVEAEGWLPPPPWRVVVLAGAHDGPGAAAGSPARVDPERELDVWESAARRRSWRQPLLSIFDGVPLTLVRDVPGDTSPGTWEWLLAVVEEVAVTTPTATASAGGSVSRPADLDRSRREATEVQRLREAGRITGTTTTVEHAWAAVTTARALGGIWTEELLGPVGVLQAHDAVHQSAYLETVAAWLDHPGDPREAARTLHVHPNTLRYRMTRLSDVVDLDLHDPETRLALRLQLRALGH
ncbi:DNA-binding PucR family transcriptional regulator [Humibacillus xanthopallidus]|uniref:DNA-binding PucR family transcriptional regulator n=1 Tax=Humibacillus xanthopallidus TaxID=412689 RepID=A0A543PQ58_9MICO|nr:PucR family transcriptional regulator [Humibacillus xanthopallidus]TQN46212.1 DNA-binding PucR family transcriptional regulator [Humibacillus xanthopallidus]